MRDRIDLPCAAAGGTDKLEASDMMLFDQPVVIFRATCEEAGDPRIYLDRDRARELFNWLGVWLLTR